MGLGITEQSATMEMEKGMVARMESASQLSLDSMASMTASRSEIRSSTTSLQSSHSTMSSSTGYSSSSAMSASTQSMSKSMSASSASLSSSQSMTVEKKAIQTSSSSTVETHAVQAAAVEQKAITIEKEAIQTKAAIAIEPAVIKSAITQVVSKPNVIVKETIHMFAGTLTHETRSNTFWTEEEVLPPVLLREGWTIIDADGILAVRQFDFAPSPVKEIQLYTCVTKDPPVEFALPIVKNKIHTTVSTLITMEKGELKLMKEEIEEDEGMFEEYWEEVRVAHYEEEQRRKSEHRRMMMEERIEETRRIQERRQILMKRIEETKGIYAYSGRRSSNMSATMSVDSPHSYRTMDSFGSVTYSPR